MGYGFYMLGYDRPAGYMVLATCDRRGCEAEIDRGLGYLCGDEPGLFPERGCGGYFCGEHSSGISERGRCRHRAASQGRLYGRVLSCMERNADGSIVCLDRSGHSEPHAWLLAAEAA